MAVTTTHLRRAAGVAAAAAGLIFIGVQIGHPSMEVASVTGTEWIVRNTLKVLMGALGLAGITGMYLLQVRRIGTLGLIGYLLFGCGYLLMLGVAFVAAYVLPSLAGTSPGYVDALLATASGGTVTGDAGPMGTVIKVEGFAYLAGGLIFGIALYRAGVLARWASALLAAGTFATVAIPLVPHAFERPFAFPTGIAMAGLGYSLWRAARAEAPAAEAAGLAPAGAR